MNPMQADIGMDVKNFGKHQRAVDLGNGRGHRISGPVGKADRAVGAAMKTNQNDFEPSPKRGVRFHRASTDQPAEAYS